MDYEKYISKKFSIAAAMAILRSKPHNVPTEIYVQELRNKIKPKEIDNTVDFDQVSVNSLDFQDDTDDDLATQIELLPVHMISKDNYNKPPLDVITVKDNCQNETQTQQIRQETQLLENQAYEMTDDSPSLLQGYEPINENLFTIISTLPNEDNNNVEMSVNAGAQEHRKRNKSLLDEDIFSKSQDTLMMEQVKNNKVKNHLTVFNNEINKDVELDFINEIINSETQLPQVEKENITESENVAIAYTNQSNMTEIVDKNEVIEELNKNIVKDDAIKKLSTENLHILNSKPINSQNENTNTTDTNSRIELLSQAIEIEVVNNSKTIECSEESKTIPFKVMLELNKVKKYLNLEPKELKKLSIESGYRSDSPFNSQSSSTAVESGIDQSAHTLLDHITTSPAPSLRHPITESAATTLASLIDTMHSRSVVLSFADAMLCAIDNQVKDLCCGFDELKKKEETAHRLKHLTISTELSSYAIDKIIDNLESLHHRHDQLTTSEVETLCHVLHCLEEILTVHMKKRGESDLYDGASDTQSIQSTITDVWRKRWQPSPTTQRAPKRRSVVDRCSLTLDKYVVTFLEVHSLISYAALLCYNCLH